MLLPRVVAIAVAAFAATTLFAASAARAADARAVLPLVGDGFALDELARLDKLSRAAAEKAFPGTQNESATKQRLDAGAANGNVCNRAVPFAPPLDCFLQAAVVVDAETLLVARVERLPSSPPLRVTAALIDVRAGAVPRVVVRSGKADAELFADVWSRMASKTARADGDLVLEHAAPDLVVRVDGAASSPVSSPASSSPASASPASSSLALPAGAHDVELSAPAMITRHERVVIESDAKVTLDAALPPAAKSEAATTATTPPPAPAATSSSFPLVGVAVGGAFAAVGATAAVIGALPRFAYSSAVSQLAAEEAALKKDPSALDDTRARNIARLGEDARANAESWSSWGEPLLVGGLAVAGVGVGVVCGALFLDGGT